MSNDVQQRPAAWEGFVGATGNQRRCPRFYSKNYTPYEGDALSGTNNRSYNQLWAE